MPKSGSAARPAPASTTKSATAPQSASPRAPKLRQQINTLFDGLVSAGATAETIARELDIPLENAAREVGKAEDRRRPSPAGCRQMVEFPDTDEAWGSVMDIAQPGLKGYARPITPERSLLRGKHESEA